MACVCVCVWKLPIGCRNLWHTSAPEWATTRMALCWYFCAFMECWWTTGSTAPLNISNYPIASNSCQISIDTTEDGDANHTYGPIAWLRLDAAHRIICYKRKLTINRIELIYTLIRFTSAHRALYSRRCVHRQRGLACKLWTHKYLLYFRNWIVAVTFMCIIRFLNKMHYTV